jgi:hypothetical protein
MALFKNLINKIHNQASSNNPVMFDSISKFDAPNMEERAMYKKGGYMMGGSPMTETMQGQMKKKMTEPVVAMLMVVKLWAVKLILLLWKKLVA